MKYDFKVKTKQTFNRERREMHEWDGAWLCAERQLQQSENVAAGLRHSRAPSSAVGVKVVTALERFSGILLTGIHGGHASIQFGLILGIFGAIQVGDQAGKFKTFLNGHAGDGLFNFGHTHGSKIAPTGF